MNDDASGTRVWLILMKAHRVLARTAARNTDELGLSDFATLELLLHKGPQPVNEIGRRIELTSGAITTAVDRMETRGLVARRADPDDRRARVVQLTAKGKTVIERAFAHHKAAMDQAADALTRAERRTLIELLKKLGTSAEQALQQGEKDHD